MTSNAYRLLFVMTYGMSLSLWKSIGRFSNEIKRLINLAKIYEKIYLITYDVSLNELYLATIINKKLGKVKIIPLRRPHIKISNILFSLTAPLIYRHTVRTCDVITTQQVFGCWIAIMLKILFKQGFIIRQGYQLSKFALHERRTLFCAIVKVLEFVTYWLADAVIVTSKGDKEYIVKHYHVNPSKVYVVPNWVDTDLFKPMSSINKEKGRIAFIGRLEYQKNIQALIEAVKGLPNVRLYIIGDGILRERLEYKVKREGISNVVFLGIIPHEKLPYELNKSELFVLPSLWEGHPKALIEAMACGLPVIGANVKGIRELIKHGYNGILCDTNSVSIRNAILLLMRSPMLRRKIGGNARKFVIKSFSLKKVMYRELALHLWLLKSRYKRRM